MHYLFVGVQKQKVSVAHRQNFIICREVVLQRSEISHFVYSSQLAIGSTGGSLDGTAAQEAVSRVDLSQDAEI